MYRGIEALPVLAKEGAIVPLSKNDKSNDCGNPEEMTIRIFRGNGSFTLYEDDGESLNFEKGQFAETKLSVTEGGRQLIFTISGASGDLSVLPEKRSYELIFDDISSAESISVKVGGRKKSFTYKNKSSKTIIYVKDVAPRSELSVELFGTQVRKNIDKKEALINLLSSYQMTTIAKGASFAPFIKDPTKPFPFKREALKGPVDEILSMEY